MLSRHDPFGCPPRPQVASARGPGGPRGTEHKRARADNEGATTNSNGKNVMEQGDADSTGTPANSIFAGTRSSAINRMVTSFLVGHGTDRRHDPFGCPPRPPVASARGPGGPRVTEHKRARADNEGATTNSNGQNAMEQGDAGRTDTPAISIFAGTSSNKINRMITSFLVGHGTDSGTPTQKPMCGTANAVAICGRGGQPESASACERPCFLVSRNGTDSGALPHKPMNGTATAVAISGRGGRPESASTCEHPGTQAPTGFFDLSANPSSGQAVPVRGSGAKRPAAAPMNIRGAFCRKSKIPRLT